jgi:MoxR-like ATPase
MTAIDLKTAPPAPIVQEAEAAAAKLAEAKKALAEIVFGQDLVLERVLVTVIAGGHARLIGVPGLAKTKLVAAMGTVLGLTSGRIQFTPDLMPFDVLGAEVLDVATDGSRSLRFERGPIFVQLLMADEINRASPKTQSALLQSMQENFVTIAGKRYDLPQPFHVLATQNPIEHEGVYPLPEAQLDRFLMEVEVFYPNLDAERQMLFETTGAAETEPRAVLAIGELQAIQRLVRRMPVGEQVVEAILKLVRRMRPDEGDPTIAKHISWAPGPRASQAFMLAARARALLDGRFAPSLDDVEALAQPVLSHRMALTFAARTDGLTARELIDRSVKASL